MPSTLRPYAALPLAWALVILVLTLTPAAEMPVTPQWELLAFDTAAHAGVFGLLALLSWFSLRRQSRWPRLARHPEWSILIGCFLFGGLIELLQSTMHMGRQGDVKDLIGDTIGAALALGLAWLLRHRIPAAPRLQYVLLLGLAVGSTQVSQAQDMARARQTIETLASKKMHGRGYVQGGEHLAADYLRGRFRALGLQPLAPNYTQPFTLDVNTFPGKIKLETSTHPMFQPGRPALQVGYDYLAAPNSGATPATWGKLLVLDSLVFSQPLIADKWQHTDVSTKALVLTQQQQQRLATLPTPLRQHLDSAYIWVTLVPKLTASLSATQASQPRVEVLADRWPSHQAHFLVNIRVDAELKRNYQTQNLAAVILGRVQPDSFLIVSAHYDHLGMMGQDTYFPGANDNASGVALLLELAAHYARPENRPACSVAFLLFGAEEAGLVGSSYFVAHPLLPLQRIKFLVNLDLLGTGEQGATVVNGRVFESAYGRLTALNAAHHYLPQLAARGRAANSDHYPFSEAGVPAFFIYTRGGSLAYHDVHDQPAALSLAGFAGAFGLVRDFLDETGASPR